MTAVVPVRAVIFDMDGLLVDTAPIWRRVGNDAFAALGVDVASFVATGALMGLTMKDAMAAFRSYAGWEPTDHPELEASIEAGVIEGISAEIELMPGARRALDFCDEHDLGIGLASGSSIQLIHAVLTRFGLRERFDVVCSAADEPLGKPHPGIFLRAAAALGVPARQCAVIEDAVSGCIAAKAASMRVIAVPDGPAVADPRLAIADAVLTTLEELPGPTVRALLGLPAGTGSAGTGSVRRPAPTP